MDSPSRSILVHRDGTAELTFAVAGRQVRVSGPLEKASETTYRFSQTCPAQQGEDAGDPLSIEGSFTVEGDVFTWCFPAPPTAPLAGACWHLVRQGGDAGVQDAGADADANVD